MMLPKLKPSLVLVGGGILFAISLWGLINLAAVLALLR